MNSGNIFKSVVCFIVTFAALTLLGGSALSFDDDNIKKKKLNSLNFIKDDLNKEQIKTLQSFRKIEGAPAYVMEYSADYHFDEYIKVGGTPEHFLSEYYISCSSFSATNTDGEAIQAYDQDYPDPHHSLVYFTNPANGYKSIALVRSDYIRSRDFYEKPESLEYRNSVLAAPYAPFDGMNEFGLCVSPMYVDSDVVIDFDKISLSMLATSRLILEYARDIDEAIELLGKYNNIGSHMQHILISDVHGNSAVIEYFRGGLVVTRNRDNHQICTNFAIDGYGQAFVNFRTACYRYRIAEAYLADHGGVVTEEEAFELLNNISQNYEPRRIARTLWSSVYNQARGTLAVCFHKNYEDKYNFELTMAVDLKVLSLAKNKKRLVRGKKIKFKIEVENNSPRYAKAGKVSVYLSRKKKINKNSINLGTVDLKPLKPEEKQKLQIQTNVPMDIKARDYYLLARIEELPNRDTDTSNDLLVNKAKITVK